MLPPNASMASSRTQSTPWTASPSTAGPSQVSLSSREQENREDTGNCCCCIFRRHHPHSPQNIEAETKSEYANEFGHLSGPEKARFDLISGIIENSQLLSDSEKTALLDALNKIAKAPSKAPLEKMMFMDKLRNLMRLPPSERNETREAIVKIAQDGSLLKEEKEKFVDAFFEIAQSQFSGKKFVRDALIETLRDRSLSNPEKLVLRNAVLLLLDSDYSESEKSALKENYNLSNIIHWSPEAQVEEFIVHVMTPFNRPTALSQDRLSNRLKDLLKAWLMKCALNRIGSIFTATASFMLKIQSDEKRQEELKTANSLPLPSKQGSSHSSQLPLDSLQRKLSTQQLSLAKIAEYTPRLFRQVSEWMKGDEVPDHLKKKLLPLMADLSHEKPHINTHSTIEATSNGAKQSVSRRGRAVSNLGRSYPIPDGRILPLSSSLDIQNKPEQPLRLRTRSPSKIAEKNPVGVTLSQIYVSPSSVNISPMRERSHTENTIPPSTHLLEEQHITIVSIQSPERFLIGMTKMYERALNIFDEWNKFDPSPSLTPPTKGSPSKDTPRRSNAFEDAEMIAALSNPCEADLDGGGLETAAKELAAKTTTVIPIRHAISFTTISNDSPSSTTPNGSGQNSATTTPRITPGEASASRRVSRSDIQITSNATDGILDLAKRNSLSGKENIQPSPQLKRPSNGKNPIATISETTTITGTEESAVPSEEIFNFNRKKSSES